MLCSDWHSRVLIGAMFKVIEMFETLGLQRSLSIPRSAIREFVVRAFDATPHDQFSSYHTWAAAYRAAHTLQLLAMKWQMISIPLKPLQLLAMLVSPRAPAVCCGAVC